jgi:hypothetical protein
VKRVRVRRKHSNAVQKRFSGRSKFEYISRRVAIERLAAGHEAESGVEKERQPRRLGLDWEVGEDARPHCR